MKSILIVEDEFIESRNLERMLLKSGYCVAGIAKSVTEALAIIDKFIPDFVLVDIFLKGEQTGIELAEILNQRRIAFLYLSANTNKTTLDGAKATRPYGFLAKPFRKKDVLVMLEIAIYQHENRQERSLPTKVYSETVSSLDSAHSGIPGIIGQSIQWRETAKLLHIVAPSETSVLILGESGTGKELIANAVHVLSRRRDGPFVKINCAALPSTLIESILFGHEKGSFTGAFERSVGKFEQANKGTVFLDEIGELAPDTQSKLLRVLQEHEIERLGGRESIKVDVRIIAATNRDLEQEIAEGRFRMDLYYRLNVFPLLTTPLRKRSSDIPLLARYFVNKFCKEEGKDPFEISSSILEKILLYPWPGNIRELENAMKRLVLLYPFQTQEMILNLITPPAISLATGEPPTAIESGGSWQEYERQYLLSVLKKCNGKISGENGAAKMLQLPSSTLESKLKKLGIKRSDYIPPNKS